MKRFFAISSLLVLFVSAPTVRSDVIVQMEIIQGGAQPEFINIQLFESVTPLTVANFLKYANGTTKKGGSYNKSFIHRSTALPPGQSPPLLIIQGGGFTFNSGNGVFANNPLTNDFLDGLQEIAKDSAVDNEFSLSNVRGTIAMAKTPGQPDSATSEWFINVADNVGLDFIEGGFTVFGEILDDSLQIVDTIAKNEAPLEVFDKKDIHLALGEIPLISYNAANPILETNLVRTESVKAVVEITADIDFGNIAIGDSVQRSVAIKNIRATDVVIGDIAIIDALSDPFSIVADTDTCSNMTIQPTDTCTLTINFSPQSEADYIDTFDIKFTSPVITDTFKLQGRAANNFAADITVATVILNIFSPADSNFTEVGVEGINFGELQLIDGETSSNTINIGLRNVGNVDLIVSAVETTGSNDFNLSPNCLSVSPIVPGDFCLMPTTFTPGILGTQTATVTVFSNDLNNTPLNIPIFGSASIDLDGVPVEIEDAAPNVGDNNIDGILDSIQSNVSSFIGKNTKYVSLVTTEGLNIINVQALDDNQLMALPEGVALDIGAFNFSINNLIPGSAVSVGIVLPQGVIVDSYYMFGPTPDNFTPHWYEFLFDGRTGAIIFGDVTFTNPSDGSSVARSVLTLFFVDGERGDSDLSSNGVILDPGGPVVRQAGESSGGMLDTLTLFSLFALMNLFRFTYKHG